MPRRGRPFLVLSLRGPLWEGPGHDEGREGEEGELNERHAGSLREVSEEHKRVKWVRD